MKIMSINAGSSSLKFSLFNMDDNSLITSGLFERIGIDGIFTIKYNGEKTKINKNFNNHKEAVEYLLEQLIELKIINSLNEIDAVGHRLVHGGDKYSDSVLITDEVIEDAKKLSELAPSHNPANIIGIETFKQVLPNTPMVAVFDTAFHSTLTPDAYLYSVPYEWYKEYGVRKYGFHGTSHKFISKTIGEYLKRDDLKVICCHLGNGASVSAIKSGKCIDTSMGFTPNAGLMMGTRAGDIDTTMIPFIMSKTGKTLDEVINDLNKKSGFLGISELSSDLRDITNAADNENNEQASLARKMFVRRVVGYISMYNTYLNGADVICFTGGIGENSVAVREMIINDLEVLGVKLDKEKNNNVVEDVELVSTDDSKIACYVIKTNEELMIAEDTMKLAK